MPTGQGQFLRYGLDISGSATNQFGIITGGGIEGETNLRDDRGSGGARRLAGGNVTPGGSATFFLSPNNYMLLLYGTQNLGTTGSLDPLIIEGGTASWAKVYDAALIEDWSLGFSEGNALEADITWGALNRSAGTGNSNGNTETSTPWEDWMCVLTLNGSEYGIESLDIDYSNNVIWKFTGDNQPTGQLRYPHGYLIGGPELGASMSMYEPVPASSLKIDEDNIPDDLSVKLVGAGPSSTITIDVLHCAPDTNSMDWTDPDSAVMWDLDLQANTQYDDVIDITVA